MNRAKLYDALSWILFLAGLLCFLGSAWLTLKHW
jgi:hypothetical protein